MLTVPIFFSVWKIHQNYLDNRCCPQQLHNIQASNRLQRAECKTSDLRLKQIKILVRSDQMKVCYTNWWKKNAIANANANTQYELKLCWGCDISQHETEMSFETEIGQIFCIFRYIHSDGVTQPLYTFIFTNRKACLRWEMAFLGNL